MSCYQIRKIYVAKKLGLKEILLSIDLNINNKKPIKIEWDKIILPDNQTININDIIGYMNRKEILMIKNNEVYELSFETKDKRIYKLITNGELDYPNLEISGQKLYNKDIPIRDLVTRITKEVTEGKTLNIGAKLGYYAINLKDVLVLEEDKYILEIMRYNPYSKKFFDKKIPYILNRIYYIRNFEDSKFNSIIYCPQPFTKATRYYYSKVLFKEFYRLLKRNGKLIIDLEPPKALTTSRLLRNIELKLRNIGFSVDIDKEYLIVIAKKC